MASTSNSALPVSEAPKKASPSTPPERVNVQFVLHPPIRPLIGEIFENPWADFLPLALFGPIIARMVAETQSKKESPAAKKEEFTRPESARAARKRKEKEMVAYAMRAKRERIAHEKAMELKAI